MPRVMRQKSASAKMAQIILALRQYQQLNQGKPLQKEFRKRPLRLQDLLQKFERGQQLPRPLQKHQAFQELILESTYLIQQISIHQLKIA